MSTPSIFTSPRSRVPASETKVGNRSGVPEIASHLVPAATCPGHLTIVGSRTPPSRVQPLLPRSGPDTPPFLPFDAQGPLSDVKMTSVLLSRPSFLMVP